MRKFLLFILFTGFSLTFSTKMNAQVSKASYNINSGFSKSDDGVLVAYPNPAKDFIIIKAKENEAKIKTVTFYSILGVQVLEYSVNMNAAEIRLDKLRPGKYLMRYTLDDNTQRVTQIIKQ
ncbi:T9SS type A sorting domain-containing protein [Chryseobacterium sp. POL2]|uniref:T9SS type A sorting domain-containing protein n=1 Tax=Chryseobacterium sp. POL2 TaxID=2713414 RepID=UPI0013E1547A|nr:T9SS type A sorting domain-containing protein [Chryseobacterium sp. POL2]QIG89445.1 T9SS type A sorting domain-containing protein [Chryseobacterium sp. POL2]